MEPAQAVLVNARNFSDHDVVGQTAVGDKFRECVEAWIRMKPRAVFYQRETEPMQLRGE